MSSPPSTRVLAVCLGNICRSPTAEAAIREAAAGADVDIEVDSAGTGAWHVGNPPDERMTAAAAEDGLHLHGRARQVTTSDFDEFDVILAMDRSNRHELLELAPTDQARSKVRLFREFAGDADSDVPDPYYGGVDGFRNVVSIVRKAAEGFVAAVQRGEL